MSGQSARAKILRYAKENKPFLVDDPEAHLSGLLDAYAHELAEQQRMWALDYVGDRDDSSYDYTYAVTLGAKLAADLIDPGAGPVRPDEETTA